jgi:hypothetical protein
MAGSPQKVEISPQQLEVHRKTYEHVILGIKVGIAFTLLVTVAGIAFILAVN